MSDFVVPVVETVVENVVETVVETETVKEYSVDIV